MFPGIVCSRFVHGWAVVIGIFLELLLSRNRGGQPWKKGPQRRDGKDHAAKS